MAFTRVINFIRWCLCAFTEKLLRWSLHPKVRSRLLKLLGARVGKNVRVSEVFIGNILFGFSGLKIDANAYIGPNCFFDLTDSIEIGARTAISPCCSFLTHSDPGSMLGNSLSRLYPRKIKGIRIGSDCWIGAGAIILCGVSIGNGSIVSAGAVVMGDVADNVIVAGNPAKFVRSVLNEE